MRVLILGAGGFIGSRITALLRSRGHHVLHAAILGAILALFAASE
jgi:nucleoside-diphosphate-sugar epimerase